MFLNQAERIVGRKKNERNEDRRMCQSVENDWNSVNWTPSRSQTDVNGCIRHPPDNSGSNFNQITSVTRCFRRTETFLIVELSHLDANSARIKQGSFNGPLHLLIENYATVHFRCVSSFFFIYFFFFVQTFRKREYFIILFWILKNKSLFLATIIENF